MHSQVGRLHSALCVPLEILVILTLPLPMGVKTSSQCEPLSGPGATGWLGFLFFK